MNNTIVLIIPAHSVFTFAVCWGSLGASFFGISWEIIQPQIIHNPDYLPGYLPVCYDYGYTSFITYTHDYTACTDYFIIYYNLITTAHVFHFHKKLLLYYTIKTIELMMCKVVLFEKVFHRTKFLVFES